MPGYGYNAKYPLSADVLALAQLLVQRQNDSGLTVFGGAGGIVNNGNPAPTPLGTPGADPLGMALAYFEGIADAVKCATGYQAFNEAPGVGSANNAASTSFAPVGNGTTTGLSTYTFVAPLAITYLVRVHVCFFCSVLAAGDFVGWQLVNTTTAGVAPNGTAAVFPTAATQRIRATFDFPLAMAAGNNVLQLQWRSGSVGTTANVTTGDYRVFAI